MEYDSKESYLWSVLPLVGTTGNNRVVGTNTTFRNSAVPKTKLTGIPYVGNNTGNPALNLIQFSAANLDGPVTAADTRIYLINTDAFVGIKWKILGVPCGVTPKIGFYTTNYFPGSLDVFKYYLFGTSKGVSLFTGTKGDFVMTGFTMFAVIVEGNFPVQLIVNYTNPTSVEVPDLLLYLPVPFMPYHCKSVAEQELIDDAGQIVLIRPKPKYIAKSQTMIDYLNAFSVTITLEDPPAPLAIEKLALDPVVIPPRTYTGAQLPMYNKNDGAAPIFDMYLKEPVASEDVCQDYWGKIWAIKFADPPSAIGRNIIPFIDLDATIGSSASNNGDTMVYNNIVFEYGEPFRASFDGATLNGANVWFNFPVVAVPLNAPVVVNFKNRMQLPANIPWTGLRVYVTDVTVTGADGNTQNHKYPWKGNLLSVRINSLTVSYVVV